MMQAYRVTMMQAYKATRGGVGTRAMPRLGGRLEALVAVAAILVVVAVMALMVWAGPLATSGTETADPGAGHFADSAVIHDDPGNVHRTLTPQGALVRGAS